MQLTRFFATILTFFMTVIAAILPGRVWLPLPEDMDGAVDAGPYSFLYDTGSGTFSAVKDGVTLFRDAYCEYARDGKTVSSREYDDITLSQTQSGDTLELTAVMRGEGLWDLTQTFAFSAQRDWFTTRVTLGAPGAATNYIAPFVITDRNLQNYKYKWTNVLEVPFDNDGWAEFKPRGLGESTRSFEVGAVFTPDGGGFVLGSLEHDLWKTAVETAGQAGKLRDLRLYCGATDPRQGTEPHGTVSGDSVSSPLMFIGAFDDWKEGMNTFARANTAICSPRRAVTDHVPFGWNSWGSIQTDLNYELAAGTSDYIKEKLQPVWGADGAAVYVNLDSYLDNLSAQELKAFVDHCHENGQKAGVYSAPFVSWWDDYGMSVSFVPGTDNAVSYDDIRLKKKDGTAYGNEVDGCIPLDVTHPATKLHVRSQIDRLKAAGFDYIKLDFLVHASFEGDFYDKSITTGIQAYNYAMSYLTEMIGDDIFINLAMSPIFPYRYANGRRFACDSYYGIGDTEYTLNAVTYGFWEKELYGFTDPDHIVIWGKDAGASEAEARSRVTSGVIAGTSFLAGDNFVAPAGDARAAFARYEKLLANADVVRAAKTGKIFSPVFSCGAARTANVYRLEADGKTYIAVINFSAIPRVFTVDTGMPRYAAKELWSGRQSSGSGLLAVSLAGKDAALFEIIPIKY